jgi:hypothetical protein
MICWGTTQGMVWTFFSPDDRHTVVMRGCLISWPPHLFSTQLWEKTAWKSPDWVRRVCDKKGDFTGEWPLPSHFDFGLGSIWWFTNFRFSAVTYVLFCVASFCCLCWKQQNVPLLKDTSESKLDIHPTERIWFVGDMTPDESSYYLSFGSVLSTSCTSIFRYCANCSPLILLLTEKTNFEQFSRLAVKVS